MQREIFSPERAQTIIEAQLKNRKLTESHAREIAGAMSRGEFRPGNGESIKFMVDGSLGDGQHRLRAIVISGISQELAVVYNQTEEDALTWDNGKRRTMADSLSRENERSYAALASSLVWYRRVTEGRVWLNTKYSRTQLHETLEVNPGLRKSVAFGVSVSFLAPSGLCTALHRAFGDINEEKANEFFSVMATGERLESGDAVFVLRDVLIRDRAKRHENRLRPPQIALLVAKAWNAFVIGKKIRMLRGAQRPSDRAKREQFPKLLG